MRATLTFNLDNPDDQLDYRRCMKSMDMALFIFDFRNKISALVDTSEDGKYINEKHLWSAWNKCLHDWEINIDSLNV